MKIGKMTVDVVVDGQLAIAKEFEYPEMSEESWKPYYGMLAENGTKVVNELGGYLVRSDDFTALVDLGFGPADVPEANGIKWYSGKFLDSLRALGVEPEDVTDIFFSHLHFDHIGWASVEGKPVFPNATYRCDQHDWDHFTDPSHVPNPEEEVFPEEMRAANKLGPIKGQLKTWSESGEILPGFSVIRTPGHSPGTTVFKIESDGESAYFIGDVAHHQAELVEDRWQGVSD
ncbi:MAG: beta-lactamase domain protein, partial [Microbacteriaceae bacterium]|nr:beta-lactamase domain protein [Microbacteriaceae bacterium]